MSKDSHPKRVTKASLENAALYYLERFAASAEQLRRVLLRRVERAARFHGDDPADGAALVAELIDRYLRAGLLDDRLYAGMRAKSLLRRGRPLRAIGGDLARRGIDPDLVTAALDDLKADCEDDHQVPDLAAAWAYARRRRLGPFRAEDRRADYHDRDLAALGRAGFSWDIAREVVEGEIDPPS